MKAWELITAVQSMTTRLKGIPPYKITLQIAVAAKFTEAAYESRLQKKSNVELLRHVLAPPTVARRPELATVALRQDVLQVKEPLRRSKPPAQGRGSASIEQRFTRGAAQVTYRFSSS